MRSQHMRKAVSGPRFFAPAAGHDEAFALFVITGIYSSMHNTWRC